MDSRDGFVECRVLIPKELAFLIKRRQIRGRSGSFQGTIRGLLESHPEIDNELQSVYAEAATSPMGE